MNILNKKAMQTQSKSLDLAGGRNKRYFFCSITEVNGEHEYPSNFLMAAGHGECPEVKFQNIFLNYAGKGDREDDNFVWYDSGLAAKDPEKIEITQAEYEVMDRYISTR